MRSNGAQVEEELLDRWSFVGSCVCVCACVYVFLCIFIAGMTILKLSEGASVLTVRAQLATVFVASPALNKRTGECAAVDQSSVVTLIFRRRPR